jgi:hypothetical protein
MQASISLKAKDFFDGGDEALSVIKCERICEN